MSKRAKIRVHILCEDQKTEHFVRKVCEGLGHSPVRTQTAPKGQGSGEAWVKKRYPNEVRLLRSYGQENVGLAVLIDGDDKGVAARKRELAEALESAGVAPRREGERIATCVPTWSIETWIAFLCGLDGVNEATRYKEDAAFKAAERSGAVTPTKAADAYLKGPLPNEAERVPSLADGRAEIARLG